MNREKNSDYCLLIPVINEGKRLILELRRAVKYHIPEMVDIIICDGGSTDGSVTEDLISSYQVNTILVKKGSRGQGEQLRMGIEFALKRNYRGILTIDGNNKDSIEHVPRFIKKLEQGYDFVQGSRFVKGGVAVRTPFLRYLAVRFIHAPLISLTAGHWFTDSTNNFRAYSADYLKDEGVAPLRDIFVTYELLAYLSVRASKLGRKVCEVPVTRRYPKGKAPTKIKSLHGNLMLIQILICNLFGKYKN